MAHQCGMLRFRQSNGQVRGVEASRVSDIQPLTSMTHGVASRINLTVPGEFFESLDDAEDLMDLYDAIVGAGYVNDPAENTRQPSDPSR